MATIKIIDPDGHEVPRGVIGEIAVKGPMTMLGYWNKPDETAAALRDGWLRTGDAAYMDTDGFVYVADRIKDMIITGGENVYSVEVENAHCTALRRGTVRGHRAFPASHGARRSTPSSSARRTQRRPRRTARPHPRSHRPLQMSAQHRRHRLPADVRRGKILKHKLREPYWRDRRAVN